MAAPRKFDESDVLQSAMLCFWRNGYEGCSIEALVAATGLKRQSLYNAFGNKEQLFESVLTLYDERVEASLRPLEPETAGIPDLQAYFLDFLALQKRLEVGSCLAVLTAYGPAMGSPRIAHAVKGAADRVRRCFAALLERVAVRSAGRQDLDFAGRASELYALLHGLSALTATGGDQRYVEQAIDRAMSEILGEFAIADATATRTGRATT